MKPRRLDLRWCLAAALWAGGPRLDGQAAAPGVIELPEFVVSDTRVLPPPESWRYARLPGFEVLSNASEGATRRFLRDFQMLQEAIGIVWPVSRQVAPPVPTLLIVYGRGGGADDFLEASARAVGDIELAFIPAPPEEGGGWFEDRRRSASRFFGDGTASCIVLDLQENDVGVIDPYRAFYREYVRHLVTRMDERAPWWVVEGVTHLFAGMDFTNKWIGFAEIGPPGTDFRTMLTGPSRRGRVPSVGEMFTREPNAQRVNSRMRPLAQAFFHMCLYGRGGRYRAPLFRFLEKIRGAEPTEAAFQECFGMDYKAMDAELRGYAGFTDYRHYVIKRKDGRALATPGRVEIRRATQAEIGRIKGQGFMLAGNRDAARAALITPYLRGERDVDLLGLLGLFEAAEGRRERARRFLEAAVMGGSAQSRVHLELARMRLADAGAEGDLTPEQLVGVLSPLRVAAQLSPPLPEVYDLMVDAWDRAGRTPASSDLDELERGVRQFPLRLALVYRAAELCSIAGEPARAARLVELGEGAAQRPADRAKFQLLRAGLPLPRPSP